MKLSPVPYGKTRLLNRSPIRCDKTKGEKFMSDKIFENNQVSIVGEIVSDFRFSHEVYGEGFYTVDVAVNRLSNFMDYIPLMISERLIDVNADYRGQIIYVTGQFRSFNRHEEKKNRLVLSVFARELEFLDGPDEECPSNQIFLDGYICKEAIYRKTPLGREIADLLVAVNRSYGKSDYIPCICWGRNARFASSFEVGTHVQIWGRIQSREYVKKLSDTEVEQRVAYEVSVSKIEM
jgi:single-stranded DNA-binding protein